MLKLKGHRGAIKALSWCPWKNSVLCSGGGTGDRSLRLWNAQENRLLSVKKTESQLSGVVWNKSSEVLISSHGHRENTIQLWKMQEDYEIKCVCEL
jgi:cell division cycle protein 20 (cofactor of APC complex)